MAEREKESEAGRLFTLQISEGQSHGKGFHDLIGGLHVLDEAVLELCLLSGVESLLGVLLVDNLISACDEHIVHH